MPDPPPLTADARHDLFEVLDDRHQRRSTLVTSQLAVEHWHDYLADPTIADAIPDRLVHNRHRITLQGEALRKRSAPNLTDTASPNPRYALRRVAGLRQNQGPASIGIAGRHRRNTYFRDFASTGRYMNVVGSTYVLQELLMRYEGELEEQQARFA